MIWQYYEMDQTHIRIGKKGRYIKAAQNCACNIGNEEKPSEPHYDDRHIVTHLFACVAFQRIRLLGGASTQPHATNIRLVTCVRPSAR